MESSSLNKAHQQQRRADALLNQKKFEDCIECHKNAIVLLMESMTLTDNQKSLESLKLQKAYHAKQIDVVKMKQKQHDKIMKTKMTFIRNSSNSSIDLESDCTEDALKTAIFHNIVVQDSLIDRLEKKRFANDDSLSTSDTDDKSAMYDKLDGVPNTLGNKHPKNDSTTIEELRILSSQLQDLVQILVTQLDERTKEVELLKSRIKKLESEQNKGSFKNNSLKVVTDSSGGTSPYVFSPCSELSPDVNELGTLPSLTPLDLPKFDYNNGYKSYSNSSNSINNN
ncbi:hypothetical protein HHI36_016144 [Cryptolaemus montrouzieri]|uniref:Nuclear receptor-binding factor 2 MIT domain-containing protein n=1 Tax=Cryptolaemus montrouzieri TaxID=559131 RepID=A0ABD2NIS3_9CUCU